MIADFAFFTVLAKTNILWKNLNESFQALFEVWCLKLCNVWNLVLKTLFLKETINQKHNLNTKWSVSGIPLEKIGAGTHGNSYRFDILMFFWNLFEHTLKMYRVTEWQSYRHPRVLSIRVGEIFFVSDFNKLPNSLCSQWD